MALAPDQFAPPAASPDTAPQNPKQELIERLKTANNVLVTVTNNPSVDQLSAAIGLTLVLNKLDKHATAVYSGKTPSTIEFLQPDKTIEKNTDSLRDFIIALDKSKADKLRYKVEDTFVKIFITPYHTSLSDKDLEFSQGDFNVDVVIALGVHKREELDEAITAHGRILHDAVTASINNQQTSDLGTLNWFEANASSLSEMVVGLIEPLQGDKVVLDEQVATAFLTGVVAETERFSNEKTTPHTMNIAATLMKAGANQQLVSSKLNVPEHKPAEPESAKISAQPKNPNAVPVPIPVAADGTLGIEHKKDEAPKPSKTLADLEKENKEDQDDEEDSDLAKIHIDEEGKLVSAEDAQRAASSPATEQTPISSNMILQPPILGGDLSSATRTTPEPASISDIDAPSLDTAATGGTGGMQHNKTIQPLDDAEKETLQQIEEKVESPHLAGAAPTSLPAVEGSAEDAARQAVADAASLQKAVPVPSSPDGVLTNEEVFPTQLIGPDQGLPLDPTAGAVNPSAPPPVPPPLTPPTF